MHELGMRVRDWVGDPDFRLHWVAQHELDEDGAPVSWCLMHLPPTLRDAAFQWLSNRMPASPLSLFSCLPDGAWLAPNTEGRAHHVHWRLVRELWRGLDPQQEERDETGRRRALRDLFGVHARCARLPGVLPRHVRRVSSSKSLGPAVWGAAETERFAFVDAFGVWHALDTGWERAEFQCRREEAERRAAVLAQICAQFPEGAGSPLTDLTREQKLRAARERWPHDPLRRPRPQPLW